MAPPQMQPKFTDAFKDPRFLITVLAIVGTAFVAHHRLGQVEENQVKAEDELSDYQSQLSNDIKERRQATEDRFKKLENFMSVPRYTLLDDEVRMEKQRERNQREFQRIQTWIDDQNKFRIQMVEFAAETRHATQEMRGLIQELKTAVGK